MSNRAQQADSWPSGRRGRFQVRPRRLCLSIRPIRALPSADLRWTGLPGPNMHVSGLHLTIAYKSCFSSHHVRLIRQSQTKMSSNRIVQLANIIQRNTEEIDAHLTLQGLPNPSFTADNPATLLFGQGPKVDAARQSVVDATDELQALMLGPTGLLSSLFVCTAWLWYLITNIISTTRFSVCKQSSDSISPNFRTGKTK